MTSAHTDLSRDRLGASPRATAPIVWAMIAILCTSLCFANAIKNDFTNWDDPLYVVENELIRSLSPESLVQIFSTFLVGNYHPLTVVSLAVDYALYGLNPFGYHLTNVVLHVANVILVLFFVWRLTRSTTLSGITACLFGVHPLHVESVAWVSERKDLLYTFFYLCSLYVYLWYIRKGSLSRALYIATLMLFLCSLLSKGQAVTLSLVLVLVDFYEGRRWTWALVREKAPFFALSLVFGVVAIVAQKDTGAIPDMPTFSLAQRFIMAFFNVYMYVSKLVAPVRLSAFYPYPRLDRWSAYLLYCLPAVCTVVVTGVAYRRLGLRILTNRLIVFACAFFLVNIVLLLQILPVGASILSERYAYLCSVGFFLLVGYAVVSIWENERQQVKQWRGVLAIVLVLYGGWLVRQTIERNKVWRDSESMWSDVLRQFPQVVVAYLNRGSYYQVRGDVERALVDFNAGLAINPDYYDILANRCDVFRIMGEYERALADCTKVITERADYIVAYTNRGITYSVLGKHDEALADFEKAIALDPGNAKLYTNRGNLFDMAGNYDGAIENYSYALSLDPDYYAAYYNRGKTKMRKRDFASAIKDFDLSVNSDVLSGDSYFYRSQAFAALGEFERALEDAHLAAKAGRVVDPGYFEQLRADLEGR